MITDMLTQNNDLLNLQEGFYNKRLKVALKDIQNAEGKQNERGKWVCVEVIIPECEADFSTVISWRRERVLPPREDALSMLMQSSAIKDIVSNLVCTVNQIWNKKISEYAWVQGPFVKTITTTGLPMKSINTYSSQQYHMNLAKKISYKSKPDTVRTII